MYPRKLTRSIISNPDYPVVETKAGKLRGLWEEGVFLFRGIQYATAKRFHLPQPVEPWEGTKEAIIYGPVCKEIHTPIAHDEYNVPHYHYIQDEDCLYLNIWTKHIEKGANRPVMDILLEKLHALNINDVICNTYYMADEIIKRYKNNNIGINFNYVKEQTLSGTAGGVKKCQHFFEKGDTFLVLSGDGLTNADLKKGIESHIKSGAIASIGIKKV